MHRFSGLLMGIVMCTSVMGIWAEEAFPMELPETMAFSEEGTQLLQGGKAASGLYDETVLRTIELNFEQADWWQQLTANYNAGVDIPADLIMDGTVYPDVGVRFRGTTSYMMTGNSQKKPFNISMDYTDPDQRLMGYRTLNLNNCNSDPSFMREVLYFNVCRNYIPSPKASFVKLVINGENWGVYDSAQQNNADLLEEWFLSNDGNRWKTGSGGGGGGNGGGTATPDTTLRGGALPGGTATPDTTLLAGQRQPGGAFQLPTFDAWAASPQAQDLDGDGQITEADYQIFVSRQQTPRGVPSDSTAVPGGQAPPSFEEWVASPQARDLDGDGQITEADYQIFVQQPGRLQKTAEWRQPGGGGMAGGGFGGGTTALTWLGSDVADYESVYELKTDNTDDPWSPLIAACDVLNNVPLEQLADTLESVLSVDRWLWFLAVENVFTDEDSYLTKGADYEIYYEVETGRIHPLQHDGNETFNTRDVRRSPVEGEGNANRPVISRLLSVPVLRQRYLAHVRTIVRESLDWDVLAPKIEAYRALIGEEVRADTKKLYSNNEFESSPATLESFVRQRREFLLTHSELARPAPEIVAIAHARLAVPSASKPAQEVAPSLLAGGTVRVTAEIGGTVSIGAVLLHYAEGLVGPFKHVPMFDDGAHGDGEAGDGTFGGDIPPFPVGSLVRYYIEARASDAVGTTAFAPPGAEHNVFVYSVSTFVADVTPIVINELMAVNDTVVQDPQGEYEDWMELLNVSDQEVDLSGMYLTDREDDLRKWAFPEGTTLAPGAYLMVWADGDNGDEPGLHTNFRLSGSGEVVLLVDTDERGNAILDSVTFGEQQADVSIGRNPDGVGALEILSFPTPGAANASMITVVSEETAGAQPERFRLEQNVPNPFNSDTVIRFALPERAEVALGIYNLLGQKVATLVQGMRSAGTYQVHWDGRDQEGNDLASGIYLYRLKAGTQVETRQLALVR